MKMTSFHSVSAPIRQRCITLLAAFLFCVAFIPAARAVGPYCAIAYSPSTFSSGQGVGYSNLGAAKARAMAECHRTDARVVVWCNRGFAALAVDTTTGRYGWGTAMSKSRARRVAINHCKSRHARVVETAWANA